MIGIVIVAHGGLACEYLAAIEHVVGDQPGIRAIAIERDHAMLLTRDTNAAHLASRYSSFIQRGKKRRLQGS